MIEWKASESEGFFRPSELSSYDPSAVGFCMSGGGYRATLFHAGAIIRMNELGMLPKLDRIASVSGGSISAGLLGKAWNKLSFNQQTGIASNLKDEFVNPVLEATARSLDVRVGLSGLLPFVSAGNRLSTLYNRYIFDDFELNALPKRPKFIFCATNLQTSGLFRFTRDYLADWRALFCEDHRIRLSDAVAASSAFPPVLAPLRLDLSNERVSVPKGARFSNPELLREPILVDGGVYDNLGLEPIWKRCGVIVSSYAGMNREAEPINFTLDHLMPVVMSFLASSIDWRERILVNLFQHTLADGKPERIGTYWTAETSIRDFPRFDGWKPSDSELSAAASTPTRLDAFDKPTQRLVINAGYAYADAGLRSYLFPNAPAPTDPPSL
jgi:NTE family protein